MSLFHSELSVNYGLIRRLFSRRLAPLQYDRHLTGSIRYFHLHLGYLKLSLKKTTFFSFVDPPVCVSLALPVIPLTSDCASL